MLAYQNRPQSLREQMRGLATLSQGIHEPFVVRDGMEDDPLVMHCFCMCSSSALLGDLLGVNRFMERDFSFCPVDLS